MKYIPILFSTPMVVAINNGSKTQTRREVKPTKKGERVYFSPDNHVPMEYRDGFGGHELKPKAQVGDVFWVRETFYAKGYWQEDGISDTGKQKWTFVDDTDWDKYVSGGYRYEHNKPDIVLTGRSSQRGYYKRPSIFMPKEACRTFLKVTNVRVERLHDISEEDAELEGIENFWKDDSGTINAFRNYLVTKQDLEKDHWAHVADDAIHSFKTLWESINGKESLESNPFVWVYDLERIEKPNNFLTK